MRTLETNEVELVAGGVLPAAIVPLIKAAGPVVATVATAATTIVGGMTVASSIERAIDKATEACKEGSEASVQSLVVDMSCSPKKEPKPAERQGTSQRTPPSGMLKAMMPELIGA